MGLLDIIYRDDDLVAINKPDALLVHRSRISRDHVVAMQLLRDQIGQFVYPVHRLDRPTSGVLLFALSSEVAQKCCALFEARKVDKRYLAVVRGATDESGQIDYELRESKDAEAKSSVTAYRRLATADTDISVSPHDGCRYSLVEAKPETGRMHQIRKHFAHIRHPLIGDRQHGDGKQNRAFEERFGIRRLLLHAERLVLPHPCTGETLELSAQLPFELSNLFSALGWAESWRVSE